MESDLSESKIQRAIAAYLDVALPAGSFWTAINPIPGKSIVAAVTSKAMGMKAGVPDILILHNGETLWIEIKREGGYLSKVQKAVHVNIEMAGGNVYTARSIDDIQEILQQWEII